MALTEPQRQYAYLAIEYQQTDDPQNAAALDCAMREMEENDPDVRALAERHTDDELAAMVEEEER